MERRKALFLVLVICALTLAGRMYFVFEAPDLTLDSHFHLRQAENILKTGFPKYQDELSYGGRSFSFSPLFAYVLAAGGLFLPMETAAKIIVQLAAIITILLSYFLMLEVTKKTAPAIVTAVLLVVLPIFFKETLYSISVHSLSIMLTLWLVYCFIHVPRKWALNGYLFGICVFSFLHPSVIIFLFGIVIYALLLKMECIKFRKEESELLLFSVFLVFWSQFVIYKQAFLSHSLNAIWQNVPSSVIAAKKISLPLAIAQIGIGTFLVGLFVICFYTFREKNKNILLLMGMVFSSGLLTWAGLVDVPTGLLYLGLMLTLFDGQGYLLWTEYVRKTKFDWARKYLRGSGVALVLLLSLPPAYVYAVHNMPDFQAETDAIRWVSENTEHPKVLLAPVEYGHLIVRLGNKNVADNDFLLVPSEERLESIEKMYTTPLQTTAIGLMFRHDVEYILFSPGMFGVESLPYLQSECFEEVYDKSGIKILRKDPDCRLERVRST